MAGLSHLAQALCVILSGNFWFTIFKKLLEFICKSVIYKWSAGGTCAFMKGEDMLNTICYWLVVIGALNYGLMAFGYNFLEKLPANIGQIVSIAVAVAAIITIVANLKK